MTRGNEWSWLRVLAEVVAIAVVVGCAQATPEAPLAGGASSGDGSSGEGDASVASSSGHGDGDGGGVGSGAVAQSGAGAASGSGASAHPPLDAGMVASHGGASSGMTPHGTSTCLQMGSGDYSKAGPYMVETKNVDLASTGELPSVDAGGLTTYDLYYPTKLEANCPHPIMTWGNGTGATTSQAYAFFHNQLASWGIVVAASNNPQAASDNAVYNKVGIDYLLAQNKDSSSPFYQKLSTRAGTSGQSQGAFAATIASVHPNVEATVQVEGGGNPKPGIAFLALSGTADTYVGTGPPTASYMAATGPSMLAVYTGADHVMTPTIAGYLQMNPGTIQFLRFYSAWFRCFLADDQTACAMFKGGSNCGVCKDPNWATLETKNM